MRFKKLATQREAQSFRLNDILYQRLETPDCDNIPEQFQDSFCSKWKNYQIARNKIFGENKISSEVSEISINNHLLKTRERHKNLRKEYKRVKKTILHVEELGTDPRPFTDVEIFGERIKGLMDSGASISVLGTGSLKFLENNKIKFKPLTSSVKTASGAALAILGKIETSIFWRNQYKTITLYIAPELRQQLYLGFDFFQLFGLDRFLVEEVNGDEEVVDVKSHQLNFEEKSQLQKVIDMFPSSFKMGLGETHLIKHFIDTGEARPIKRRHYPISPAKERLLFVELDRMKSLGVIEESLSPWSSPITTVVKPGKTRMCIDCRDLNKVTVKDAYPIPNIDGLLMRLTETRFISALDLKDAFWQIPLEESSKEKTAFTVAGRPLYQFKVMPFGLCNAPQTMCRLMDLVIPGELRHRVFVYLDDLLIFSNSFEEHLDLLRLVAKRIQISGLTLNIQKSKFCMKEVNYLGYIVGEGGLRTSDEKVQSIRNFSEPRTPKELRRFLGMAGYYRKFIPNFSDMASPLTNLYTKGTKFVFTDEARIAMENIKTALTTAPILIHPNYSKPFIIQCDASSYGIGAVLCQLDDCKTERPIFYFSKKLNKAQRNYSVTEQECLAAVKAVEKFRPYVEMQPFKVITDHASLKWLMNQRDLSGRLARWSMALAKYDFSIEHRKGSEHIVPDALSRAFHDIEEIELHFIDIDLNSPEFDSIDYVELRNSCIELQNSVPDVKVTGRHIFRRTNHSTGMISDEFQNWKLWIPISLSESLISAAHNPPDVAHCGIAKTIYKLREKYFWPNMALQVKNFIQRCEICKCVKPSNTITRPPIGEPVLSKRAFQKIYIDFMGPYPKSKNGNTVLLVILDHFTKYTLLQALPKATAVEVVKFLEEIVFPLFGVAETIHTDNGRQFTSNKFENIMTKYQIKHMYNPLYTPQCNASERVNRNILSAIRAYVKDDHRDWDRYIKEIGISLRNTLHSSIGTTPHFALFGNHMITHGSSYPIITKLESMEGNDLRLALPDKMELIGSTILNNATKAHERAAKLYNRNTKKNQFYIGQEIYRRNFQISSLDKFFSAKLAPKYVKGLIKDKVGNNMYHVVNLDGKSCGIFHAKDLKT